VVSTHFDHVGQVARLNSAAQLRQMLCEEPLRSCPTILAGDFNSIKRGSDVFATLTQEGSDGTGTRWVDVWADGMCTERETNGLHPFLGSTMHKFDGLSFDGDMGDGSVSLLVGGDAGSGGVGSCHIDWVLLGEGKQQAAAISLERVRIVTRSLPAGCSETGAETAKTKPLMPSDHFPIALEFRLLSANSTATVSGGGVASSSSSATANLITARLQQFKLDADQFWRLGLVQLSQIEHGISLVAKRVGGKRLSNPEWQELQVQTGNVAKVAVLLPMIVLPFGSVAAAMCFMLAQQFGIDLRPSAFKGWR
jgi:hypothetical protein